MTSSPPAQAHTQLPAFIELVREQARRSKRERKRKKNGKKKKKKEHDGLSVAAVPSGALRGPRPAPGAPSPAAASPATAAAPVPPRSSRPEPPLHPGEQAPESGRRLPEGAPPRPAAGGVPGRCRAPLPAAAAAAAPTAPGRRRAPGRGRAADPGARSRARRAGCFLSALTSLSLGDPRLNLHRAAETDRCRGSFLRGRAEIQAGPFEVNRGTARCGGAVAALPGGAPGLPQHGGPPAPSGPRHRPGFCRLRSPARRSRAGAGAQQLAEPHGHRPGSPRG